ncbi:c-type cytochrome [Aromatoleum toluolicum]|uniref:Cytochrome c domain-containing protein n=1 Tax=Aromatoleum toluolicum TaxID=90060 RepID=A0ABX1NH72_9RHOO|nr:c-type cytochrome [Aromatoleum toluolicum]NMF98656.1 c-type cytochrome [Aromatoleum toluolicum]
MKPLAPGPKKAARLALLIGVLLALYALAVAKHEERQRIRDQAVTLTPGCADKLARYGLVAGATYVSPYTLARSGQAIVRQGYSDEDVRAIQRGCNIIDDLQGQLAADPARERWNATRFVRGTHTSCDHCHQGIGDKQTADGVPQPGSLSLAASWVMADMYDQFTGILLPYELRQMQCYINSSNGFKPNIADDLIRDVTAYGRFLAAALDLRFGNRYQEQGIDEVTASSTLKRGDDYVRGGALFRDRCARCHGPQGLGTVVDGKVLFPAVAGPNAFNLQSRNNFSFVSTILPGFICRNMPPGEEGSLSNQDCRDIAFYVSNLPRPAGDKQGPLAALWQQLMMRVMPPLIRTVESWQRPAEPGGSGT